MYKQYKTVRLARETKYWLNELIVFKEQQLKKEKDKLIEKYELELKSNPDFFHGYSPTISIAVTSGSILEAAYRYTEKNINEINWNNVITEMEKKKKDIDKNLDVGTLTPRFYLYTDILEGLEKYQWKLKAPEMQRNLMLNYVIKMIIFNYYQKVILENYEDD